jgi:hypothetical protein
MSFTVIWLLVWLFSHTPQVALFGNWNNWGIALTLCVLIDVLTIKRE